MRIGWIMHKGPRLALITALTAIGAVGAGGATMGIKETAEKLIVDYSASRRARPRFSGPISVTVRPFVCGEYFKQEDVGALAAEIIAQHLMGIKQIKVMQNEPAATRPEDADGNKEIQERYSSGLLMTGSIDHNDDQYLIKISLLDRATQAEIDQRQVVLSDRDFRKILARHFRWKHKTWAIQPYLQALYSERYLADGFPSRLINISHLGVSASVMIEPARLAIDETAEFSGGMRLAYRKRLMLDLTYTGHGHSTSEGQYIVTMTGSTTPVGRSRLLMYVNSSALSAALCGTARLYGDLLGYVGAGWERTTASQTVSSMSRLWFSGPAGSTEVRGYFLSPQGPMEAGGVVKDHCSLPIIKAGFEWRPNRLGFNLLATYRLGNGNFRPLGIAVEELFSAGGLDPQRISYTTMDVTRYHLPRFSIGAAFTLSL